MVFPFGPHRVPFGGAPSSLAPAAVSYQDDDDVVVHPIQRSPFGVTWVHDDWWKVYPFGTRRCDAGDAWLRDIAQALDNDRLAGLLLAQDLSMGFCPYTVQGQIGGLKFAFAAPSGGSLLVCVLCYQSAVLQLAVPLPWATLTELHAVLNPHVLLPWCLGRVTIAEQIYVNWRDGPSEFLKPLPVTVDAAVAALGRRPTHGCVLLLCCTLPGWEPQDSEARRTPGKYAGKGSWSCPVPLLAEERARFIDMFFTDLRVLG